MAWKSYKGNNMHKVYVNNRKDAAGSTPELLKAQQVSQIYRKNCALYPPKRVEIWEDGDLGEAFWKTVDDLKKAQQGQ